MEHNAWVFLLACGAVPSTSNPPACLQAALNGKVHHGGLGCARRHLEGALPGAHIVWGVAAQAVVQSHTPGQLLSTLVAQLGGGAAASSSQGQCGGCGCSDAAQNATATAAASAD